MTEPETNVELLEIWTYRSDLGDVRAASLADYAVEATDGGVGKIDEATDEVGASCLIVDTGPWIFGKKVMLPAGVITAVDADDRVVRVDRSKEEIKNAPPFNPDRDRTDTYRAELAAYYAPTAHEAARAGDRIRKTG
jgi:hypothetical protein